jgi:hypothetical protein
MLLPGFEQTFEIVTSGREGWIELESVPVSGNGNLSLALPEKIVAEAIINFLGVRRKFKSLKIILQRFLETALALEKEAQVNTRPKISRLGFERQLETHFSFLQLALRGREQSKAELRVGVIRLRAQYRSILGDGFLVSAHRGEHEA